MAKTMFSEAIVGAVVGDGKCYWESGCHDGDIMSGTVLNQYTFIKVKEGGFDTLLCILYHHL